MLVALYKLWCRLAAFWHVPCKWPRWCFLGHTKCSTMVQPHIYAKNILIYYYILSKKALTSVLSSLTTWTATVLEDLFGEYHSSSAALGCTQPEVTRQVCDQWATSEALMLLNRHLAWNTEGSLCRGQIYSNSRKMAFRTTTVDICCT